MLPRRIFIKRRFCCGLLLSLVWCQAKTSALTKSCSSRATFTEGNDLLTEKHYEEAARSPDRLGKCSQLSPLDTLYSQAGVYRALGKNEQAALLFRQLRSENPDLLEETGDRRLNETLSDRGFSR